jgi:protein involved in polysaccharide export with SLBB domain
MKGSQQFCRPARSGLILLLPVLCFILLLSGCGSKTYREVTPDSPVLHAVDQYGVQNGGETYRIKPGDTLRLSFFYDSNLNQEVIVRPDGKVSLLLVDDIMAAGRVPQDLDRELTEAYAAFYTRPEVTVAVVDIAEAVVYIGGEVRNPSMITLNGRMTAMQAIMRSGGFANSAKVKQVLLVRRTPEGERQIYSLNLRDTMNMESSLDDVYLQSADLLIVPQKAISKVNQFVDEYITGIIPLQFNVMFRYLYGKNYFVNQDITN